MSKYYLVTGGAGFIGSAIARRLIASGNFVTIVDNLRTGSEGNIPDSDRCEFFELDIRFSNQLEAIPNYPYDAIFHLAGQSSGQLSYEDPSYDLETNISGTLNLLQFAVKRNIIRFLNASTMGVYGQPENGDDPVCESSVPKPISFYGLSKLTAEKYCELFAQSYELNLTSFRMFNVYGPGQNLLNTKQGMVSIFLAKALYGKQILVKGSKDRFRDFIYIDDVVEAWIAALENNVSIGKIYNLGTGRQTLVEDLVNEIIKSAKIDQTPPVLYEGSTPADQFGIFPNIERIRSDLLWTPKVALEIGIKEMFDFYKKGLSASS